jgi:uncharacterized repeat protein (TIGR03803 family)
MHSKARSHGSIFGPSWSPANAALAIMLTLLFLILLLLFMTLTAQPAQGQNSVPPTAVQAATMPQFASRLAPPAKGPSAPASAPGRKRPGPRDSNDIYDNGTTNGNTDAWTINFGFIVSDSFNVTATSANVTGMTFAAWLSPGDTVTSVEVSITSSPFGGTSYFDQTVNFTQSNCVTNNYGYNVCSETTSFTGPNLNAGPYWVNLQNASVPNGDPAYWDENSGPSQADQNQVGSIPSESFTILGSTTTTCVPPECEPPPQCVSSGGNFEIIHNFTSTEQSPAPGLATTQEGKLYGATGSGGNDGLGLAYQLVESGQNWTFNPLYSFTGGTNGQTPLPGVIGPDKALYGTAGGGIQTCGSSGNEYCGVVYRLTPGPTACLTALCSWSENVIYRFTGNPDGSQPNGNLVFDHGGNLYGTTTNGGAYGQGAIYKVTPSNSGWTETLIHSFTGGSDGGQPASLLLGQDGNLYGTTYAGGSAGGGGVIFQLMPSGGSWTETVITSYAPCTGGYYDCPIPRLIQESSGNFYGINTYSLYQCWAECWWNTYAVVFEMSPSDGGWQFTTLLDSCQILIGCNEFDYGFNVFKDLTIDAAGNVYTTQGIQGFGGMEEVYFGAVYKGTQFPQYPLVGFGGDDFRDVEVDASGNLYGTTGACGGSPGTVWQLSP